jgi:DNA-binding winged helix-turn-helix (wHTH) protein/Tfp pilus assembly protein PilF
MLIIGEWIFDPASRRLLCGREERRLSPKAADVLLALAETPHLVWSRDSLIERIWPNVIVGEEVLTHAIAELRTGLGDDFRAPVFIETVYKRGYRLKCDVDRPAESLDGLASADGWELHDYARYLEACELFERGGTRNTSRAATMFGDVCAADPGFAPAQAGAAKAIGFLGIYYQPQSTDLAQGLLHGEAAIRGDPRSAEAFAATGFIHAIGGHHARAMRHFRVAVQLDPRSSDVHYLLGRACFADLDASLAAPMLERAAALRGDDYHSLMLAGKARAMRGEEPAARADFAQAAGRIRPRLEAHPADYRALCGLSRCLVQLGRLDEAHALLDRVRDHSDPMNYHLACTFARAGETARALDTLEQVVDHGWNHRAWLDRDPDFDGLRGDRRFNRIAESIATH